MLELYVILPEKHHQALQHVAMMRSQQLDVLLWEGSVMTLSLCSKNRDLLPPNVTLPVISSLLRTATLL